MQIKEIILQTHLINELKDFYHGNLGLKITDESSCSFRVKAGVTEIEFEQTKHSLTDKPFYHFAFNIPENQLSEAKQWILSKVETIKLNGEDEFDFKSWNAHSVYFYDPAGNIVELIARHNLNNSSEEKFSGESLLCISEIGIPVYDIKDFLDKIPESLKIPHFSGDNENFLAAGDENGLLILVKTGRKWYPDCPEAEIFPLEITVMSDSERQLCFEEINFKINFQPVINIR